MHTCIHAYMHAYMNTHHETWDAHMYKLHLCTYFSCIHSYVHIDSTFPERRYCLIRIVAELCGTYEWVLAHIQMSHGTRLNETYQIIQTQQAHSKSRTSTVAALWDYARNLYVQEQRADLAQQGCCFVLLTWGWERVETRLESSS